MPRQFIDVLTSVFSAAAKTLVLDADKVAEMLPKGVALDSAEATQALQRAGEHL